MYKLKKIIINDVMFKHNKNNTIIFDDNESIINIVGENGTYKTSFFNKIYNVWSDIYNYEYDNNVDKYNCRYDLFFKYTESNKNINIALFDTFNMFFGPYTSIQNILINCKKIHIVIFESDGTKKFCVYNDHINIKKKYYDNDIYKIDERIEQTLIKNIDETQKKNTIKYLKMKKKIITKYMSRCVTKYNKMKKDHEIIKMIENSLGEIKEKSYEKQKKNVHTKSSLFEYILSDDNIIKYIINNNNEYKTVHSITQLSYILLCKINNTEHKNERYLFIISLLKNEYFMKRVIGKDINNEIFNIKNLQGLLFFLHIIKEYKNVFKINFKKNTDIFKNKNEILKFIMKEFILNNINIKYITGTVLDNTNVNVINLHGNNNKANKIFYTNIFNKLDTRVRFILTHFKYSYEKELDKSIILQINNILDKYSFEFNILDNYSKIKNIYNDISLAFINFLLKQHNIIEYYYNYTNKKLSNDNMTFLENVIESARFHYNEKGYVLSQGQEQIVDTLIFMIFNSKCVILYDEPCPNISKWQSLEFKKFIQCNTYKKNDMQILLISHNENLIDPLHNKTLLFKKNNKYNDYYIKNFSNNGFNRINFIIPELLMLNKCVLVEGYLDYVFFNRFFNEKKHILNFVHCGGKPGVLNAMQFCDKYDIKYIGIIDETENNKYTKENLRDILLYKQNYSIGDINITNKSIKNKLIILQGYHIGEYKFNEDNKIIFSENKKNIENNIILNNIISSITKKFILIKKILNKSVLKNIMEMNEILTKNNILLDKLSTEINKIKEIINNNDISTELYNLINVINDANDVCDIIINTTNLNKIIKDVDGVYKKIETIKKIIKQKKCVVGEFALETLYNCFNNVIEKKNKNEHFFENIIYFNHDNLKNDTIMHKIISLLLKYETF